MSSSKSKALEHGDMLPVVDSRFLAGKQTGRSPHTLFLAPYTREFKLWQKCIVIIGSSLYALHAFSSRYFYVTPAGTPAQIEVGSVGVDVPEHIQRMWGQYSPYYAAGEYALPPQVNILQRHGARFPTESDAPSYRSAINKLSSVENYSDTRLDFLEDYEYALDEEDLAPLGAEQSWDAGVEAFERYRSLFGNEKKTVFVRVSNALRVVDSAGNWTKGFADASQQHLSPRINQFLSEEVNNTLNNDCPAASDGVAEMNTWLHHFAPPVAARLNIAAPGANLSDDDVFALMAMCPFESIAMARASAHPGPDTKKAKARSNFCVLFSEEEWQAFEYHGDVEKYYKTGPGNPLGPVQGAGYTNELVARLTGTSVRDHTTHNASLPFPLHHTIYADFSHENAMVAVFAAMGLFDARDARAPDPHRMPEREENEKGKSVWRASRMVPFSARMVVERLECNASEEEQGRPRGTYVRILVNDALQPVEFCGATVDEQMCELSAFVQSQEYARRDAEGDFERCYK